MSKNHIEIKEIIKTVNKINTNQQFSGKEGLAEMNDYIETTNQINGTNIPKIRNTNVDPNNLLDPIGILDPEGLKDNPLTGEPYQDIYFNSSKNVGEHNVSYKFLSGIWSNFPMYKKRDEAIRAIYENQVVLIISGTGSGKTVLTPKFALHALNYQGRIAITNPKRIPSKENAIYAAKTLDVPLGKQVGLKYRGSDSDWYDAKETNLLYCTDGYILARLQSDPMLSEFDCVIIDEAHERGIQIDLLLMLLKDLILRRPTFKLIIMSATVNESIFVNYFPKDKFKFALVDAGSVPNFPIEEFFLDKAINKFDENGNLINDAFIEAAADRAIKILRDTEEGDILIFFSGKGEAQEGCLKLHQKLEQVNKNLDSKIYCDILHGATPKETQDLLVNDKKYKENGRYTRKVIVATEVAESSITFKGLDFVIDSGLVNQNIYYSEKDMLSLEKRYISKASHRQRMGRVGRKRPGTCYNLFTKEEYEKQFPDFTRAPILVDNISAELLFFLSKKYFVSHIDYPFTYRKNNNNKKGGNAIANIEKQEGMEFSQFLGKLIEPPPTDNVKRALLRMEALDAIAVNNHMRGEVTDMGRGMAVFGTLPEIGRMLIAGYNYKCRDEITDLAAIFEVSEMRLDSIFERFSTKIKDENEKKREKERYQKLKKKYASQYGDTFSLLNIYADFYERRYDTVDRRTGRIIREKKGDAKEWCKQNFMVYKNLEKVKNTAKDYNRKFGKVIEIFRESHPNEKPEFLFLNTQPQISNKSEDNILRAILEGFYINFMKNVGKKYVNCFPQEKTTASIVQESLYTAVKSPSKYLLYSQLKSIFGRGGYGIVTKVPPTIVDILKNDTRGKYIESCFKKMDIEKTEKKDKHREKRSKSPKKKKSKYSRKR